MKRPLETARRWLAQAQHRLSVCRSMLDNDIWSDACFQAEQTAQLALKAFLYRVGRRSIPIHSIRELVVESGKNDPELLQFLGQAGVLDRYYLTTRYPDSLPAPAVPFESYTQEEALEALTFAAEIVDAVKSRVPPVSS